VKIVKLTVSRGTSKEIKCGREWVKRNFVLEAELCPTDELDQVKTRLEEQLEEWLE